MPAPLLIELAAEGHRRPEVALRVEERADPADPVVPLLPRRPELLHGLGNLLQNAIEFAREEVKVTIAWNAAEIGITISDDGKGFPRELLDRLGDPYLSSGTDMKNTPERKGDHMGLGIFIAQQLIERSGGSVSFDNNSYGGAKVIATWPRSAFEGASEDD
jgi:two-component system sensor histidine kinase RegB